MNAKTQHTPGLWTQGHAPGAHWVRVPGVARGINAGSAERAAFIVRACNAHDGLLAALENLLAEVCTTEAGLSATTPIAREHAAQAIAKARGET